jgi:hypothetical protein
MEHLARFHSSSPRHRNRLRQLARAHRPIRAYGKLAPRSISGAQNEDFPKEILACLHIGKPAKAVLAFLGTGWQRFRFRLGRPRAEAHVWGKGGAHPH